MKIFKRVNLLALLIIIMISTTAFAATTSSAKTTLQITDNPVCTINIGDTAVFEKRVTDYDLDKKELTIKLSIKNIAEEILNNPTEIVFVIDNSLSMDNEVSTGVTRLKAVTDSAKTLATKLLENDTVKIAVVSFSTGDNEGTLTDATLRNKLTTDSSTVLTSIDNIATDDNKGPRTNIDAGLQVASSCFSTEENNKYIVLLTDGVPNTAVGGPTFTYSAEVATKTKATLKSLDSSNINIISAMIGLEESVVEPSTGLTYKALSEEVFGTSANPTVGKFYYVPDSGIEKAICETILSNFTDTSANTLTNIDIYDYFPQEIVDNFNFEYVVSPTLGTASSKIDTTNNTIVWHINTLEPKSSGYLTYKLTVKENIDSSIINVVLNTNKKVEITAKEIKTDDGSNVLTSTVSPKIKLVQDTTVADTVIPQTGINSTLYIIIGMVLFVAIVTGFKFIILNKKMK